MKQTAARDLLLLAVVAQRNGRFSEAGSLFGACLASDDIDDFLEEVDEEGVLKEEASRPIDDWAVQGSSDAPRIGLRQIAKEFGEGLMHVSLSAEDEAEDEDDVAVEDGIDDTIIDDSEDEESDDFNEEISGQRIIPSSLSSDAGGGQSLPRLDLLSGVKSPVRLKAISE